VTYTASVAAIAPGNGTPTGSVTFAFDGVSQATSVSLSGGTGTFLYSGLSVGVHQVTAGYSGDANFAASVNTNSPLNQLVSKASSSTSVTSAGSSVAGQPVTFTAAIAAVSPGAGLPTGSVTFFVDGTQMLPAATVSSGQATFATPLLFGSHHITATYNGDNSFLSSNNSGSSYIQNVSQDGTTTTVSPSFNPAGANQSFTLSATVTPVAPGTGAPTGTVTFTIDSVAQVPASLTNGVATITTALALGSHTVTAAYNGDTSFTTSTSATLNENVINAALTTLKASASSSTYGQPLSYTASVSAVAPATGTPTGTMTFTIDGTPQTTATLVNGVATYSTSSLPAGKHTVTAIYSGDGVNFAGSSASVNQTVSRDGTTINVNRNPSSAVFSQTLTLTANITAAAPGAGNPTGTVTFTIDNVAQTPAAMVNGGQASTTVSGLSVGSHSITVAYTGDSNFTGTGTTFNYSVAQAGTTTALTNSGAVFFGQGVTFTAAVSTTTAGAGTPAGTITFAVDGVNQGGAINLHNGVATLSLPALAGGAHTISATFNGGVDFGNSAANTSYTVAADKTTASVVSSAATSVFSQSVTFTATIANTSTAAVPTGSVQFQVDGINQGAPVTLNAGTALLIMKNLAVGPHTITVNYAGNANFAAPSSSTGANQTVNQASTTTTVSASATPAIFGKPLTFTAVVAPVFPGSGTPTGTVNFAIVGGSSTINVSALLKNGKATVSTAKLAPGGYTVTATYVPPAGSGYAASTSLPLAEFVNRASSTRLTSSHNPALKGQAVTFTATLNSTAAIGTITFYVDGVLVATLDVVNGRASYTTTGLSLGRHTIRAVYSGDPIYLPSGAALIETVYRTTTRRL
jgi:hypothetical protein